MFLERLQDYDKRSRHSNYLLLRDTNHLKEYVFRDAIPQGLVKEYIQQKIAQPDSKAYRIVDAQFKNYFLQEALLEYDRAIYNWSAFKRLMTDGLWTWGFVTLYYSQFFCIQAMLNIQGVAFPKVRLRSGIAPFIVFTSDYKNGEYFIEKGGAYKAHQSIWEIYYELFKNPTFRIEEFKELYSYDKDNKLELVKLRNELNYNLDYKMQEYQKTHEEIDEFSSYMRKNVFERPESDWDEHELEKISTLRLKLVHDSLEEILKKNTYRNNVRNCTKRIEMLENTNDHTPVLDIYKTWMYKQ